jgi:hypothetical protein
MCGGGKSCGRMDEPVAKLVQTSEPSYNINNFNNLQSDPVCTLELLRLFDIALGTSTETLTAAESITGRT